MLRFLARPLLLGFPCPGACTGESLPLSLLCRSIYSLRAWLALSVRPDGHKHPSVAHIACFTVLSLQPLSGDAGSHFQRSIW